MRPLDYRPLWLALGWSLAGGIVWLSLTSAPPQPVSFQYNDKVGHLGAYALLMAWFVGLYQSRRGLALHAGLFVAMGVGLEFLQGLGGLRQFEVADMAANALGVGLGLLAVRTPWPRWLRRLDRRLAAL